MKKLNLIVAALLVTSGVFAQTWTVDKAHSALGFTVSHLMVSEVDGAFKTFDSKITSSKEDFSDAVIELTAETGSVSTNNEKRDQHLASPDFFDAAKFPTLTFKSKSIKKVEGKKYKVTGGLTFHGVTKPVELEATFKVLPFTRSPRKPLLVLRLQVSSSVPISASALQLLLLWLATK